MMRDEETELEEFVQEGATLRISLEAKLLGKKELRGVINWFDDNCINITTMDAGEQRKVTIYKNSIVGYRRSDEETGAL